MIRLIRIYIKYLRIFLAGFISIFPVMRSKSKSYPFVKENKALDKDWELVAEDFKITINKAKYQ